MLRSPFSRLASAGLALLFAAPALAGPKARVEPAVIELGTIPEGNEFERFLTVTNDGDAMLIIEDVKTSCGCTAAGVEGSVELKPGESKEIKVTFNSRGMDGGISKKVTVVTNDPEETSRVVELKAVVHVPVRWEPKYLSLDGVRQKQPWEKTAILQADQSLGLQVKEAFILGGRPPDEKPTELFDVEVGQVRKETDRDAVDFKVSLRPGLGPQRFAETLVVLTNLPAGRDTLRLPIRGEIVGRITVRPPYAVMRVVPPGEESVRDVTLTAAEGTFHVVSAEVQDGKLSVEVLEQEGAKQTLIRLHYVGEEDGAGGVKTLKIVTDDPDQPEIQVPVRYTTRTSGGTTAAAQSGEG
ncbi:MAG: DUF1573 domain-containing protein [bacterium]